MKSASTFDNFASDYRTSVETSVAFAGKGLDFYQQAKVDYLVHALRQFGQDPRSCRALDVGCGAGGVDQLLQPQVAEISGVDVSANMVEVASAANPGIAYQAYDGRHLPFADGTFDLSFSICVFHHVPSPQWNELASELLRVTRPGGLSVIIEHNRLNPLTRRAVNDCPFDEDAVLLSPRRASAAFTHSGGRVVSRRYILFVPFGGARTRRAESAFRHLPLGAQYLVAATPGNPRTGR